MNSLVTFTCSNSGKTFCVDPGRIMHVETYTDPKTKQLIHSKTFVNFLSPNVIIADNQAIILDSAKSPIIFATVDMTVNDFVDSVLMNSKEIVNND